MQLSRKQVILIAVLSGVLLILTVAAALIFTSGDADTPAEPTTAPTETPAPTGTPVPTVTSTATTFRLPLAPLWDTPRPTPESAGAGVFAPHTAAPPGTAVPWVGAYDEHTKDILAVGLQKGRTAALLWMRLDKNGLTVAALPADVADGSGQPLEETLLKGEDLRAQGEEAAKLVEEATGMRCKAWLALDISCIPAVLQVTGSLSGQGAEALAGDGRQRAQRAMALATSAATYVQQVSLMKLPALKRAVGDGFASNLSALELWSLFWTVRSGIVIRSFLLPGNSQQADISFLQIFFKESS